MKHIIVYTKPTCPQFRSTLRALERTSLDYDAIDISADAEAPRLRDEPRSSAGPSCDRRHRHWSGYRPDHITDLARYIA
jgi:glutaredoxin-like protein NrdH